MRKMFATGVNAARRARRLRQGTALVAGLAIAAPAMAEPGVPADNEVIGYATAERGGASTSWILADGAPYLFVPDVGAAVSGSVAAVETGAGVGAVLFERPYFESRDAGCTPELGSDARPDLKWRGATARFSPPVEAPASEPAGAPAGAAAKGIASLIVYRQDLGPPPGALLLNRRLTVGSPCRLAVHKTLFDRIFVPIAAPPQPARCYNLAGAYPQEGGKEIKANFTSADRLALLQPADLDDRYRGLPHRFRVTLYDGEGCRGSAGEYRSVGKEPGDIRLDQVGLRGRVRSVRIAYEGGPLSAFYAVPAAAPMASESPPPPRPAAPEADLANPIPAPEKLDDPAPARRQTTAIPLFAALPAPSLRMPAAEPAAPAPIAGSKTFEYPVYEIYRLNFCLRWDADCGEPAATAWCRTQGFAKARAWKVDQDIGSLFPTIVLADKRVCADLPCDGFTEITCIAEDPAPPPARQTTTKG